MASTSFKQPIQSCIASANSVIDLIPFLNHIPLEAIKAFANQQFESLYNNALRTAYYKSVSMNDIFPKDITQHILSFAGFYRTMSVSKTWKQCSEKNVKNYLKISYESINMPPNEMKYDDTENVTIIVDQNRPHLHKIEKELGFLINNLYAALNECEAGDRILIHNGHYSCHGDIGNIQLIGIGNDVVLEVDDLQTFGKTKTYIENVTLRYLNHRSIKSDVLFLAANSKLWMNNCVMAIDEQVNGITVRNGSDLTADNCTFDGGSYSIVINPFAGDVRISNCVFKNTAIHRAPHRHDIYAAVSVYGEVVGSEHEHIVNLQCIGNVFEDISAVCYPIVEMYEANAGIAGYLKQNPPILGNNRLKSFICSPHTNKCVGKDPNKLYHSIISVEAVMERPYTTWYSNSSLKYLRHPAM